MTDQQLRDELHRIAERAPEAYVPTDLFARGRRAHRRSVVIAISAISAAIVLIAGSVALAPTRDSADLDPARNRGDLAVPDKIYAAPRWMAETEDGEYVNAARLEHNLDIGVGAIAYVQSAQDSNGALAVVIDADDGNYHPLALDDFIGLDPYWKNSYGDGVGHRPLALSPDGTHLAWAWGTGKVTPDDGPATGGVRIADLITGETSEWDLSDETGTYVTSMEWSDGGNQLLWTGFEAERWSTDAYVPGDPRAGAISRTSGAATPYAGRISDGMYAATSLGLWAVSDDGAIAFNGLGGSKLPVQQPTGKITELPMPKEASTWDPIEFHGSDLYVTTFRDRERRSYLTRLDGAGPDFPAPKWAVPAMVGWAGDAPLFTIHGQGGISFGQVKAADNAANANDRGATSLIEFGGDESVVADTVSVAYALIDGDSEHPTVHRFRPIFLPLWTGAAMLWLIAVAVVLAVVVAIRWRRTRRVLAASIRLAGILAAVCAFIFFDPAGFLPQGAKVEGSGGTIEIMSSSPDSETPGRAVIPRRIRWADPFTEPDVPVSDVPVVDSLAVGRAILAFGDESNAIDDQENCEEYCEGVAVVITTDGEYRRLALPGTDSFFAMQDEGAMRLSPDGLRLAYVTEEQALNVIDLTTGEIAAHPLDMDGNRITSFSWSPDSRWLVWDSDYEEQNAGRITPDGATEPLPGRNWANAGIGNDGTVVARTGSGTQVWPEGEGDLPDTGQEAMSTWVGSSAPVRGVEDPGVRSIGTDGSLDVDLAIGRDPLIRGVDVDARTLVGVAGWMADGTPLIVTSGDNGSDLRTVSPDGETETVARLDQRTTQLSVATALPADLDVTPPDPAWARTDRLPIILAVAGAAGLVGFLVWRRIRRRRTSSRAPGPRPDERGY